MTVNKTNSANPPFQTPDPDQLQSKDSRDTTLEELTQHQGTETDVADGDRLEDKMDSPDAEPKPEHRDDLASRQVGITSRLPG